MEHTDASDQRAQFAEWLRRELIKRGYDLSPRGGGQTAFVRDSGIANGTVNRLLNGTTTPDIRVLRHVATALEEPLANVLIAAGVSTPEEMHGLHHRDPSKPPITIEEAADELGIFDPRLREVFTATVQALQRPAPAEDAD